jgi:2'-5' RNA ligase
MSDPSVRLFLGIGIPEGRLEALGRSVAPIRDELRGARWVAIENQHVTIKFLGRTAADIVDGVVEAARAAASDHPRWTTELTHLGAFPNLRRARVLWAALDDAEGAMTGLAARVDERTEPLGFEPEKRAFTPHLTIARFKVPGPLPALPEREGAALEPFGVDELRMYRSHLSPRGARYEILERLPLGGGDGT